MKERLKGMSSYVNFYLRANEIFAPIGSYSRSSEVYKAIDKYVGYNELVSLTPEIFNDVIQEVEEKIARMRKRRAVDENRIRLIMDSANSTMDEKLQAVNDIECNFEEMDAYVDELNFAADVMRVFINMIDAYEYGGDGGLDNDPNHYIYAGIDAIGSMEYVVDKE